MDSDSDEEFLTELQNAVSKHRRNKSAEVSKAKSSVGDPKTKNHEVFRNQNTGSPSKNDRNVEMQKFKDYLSGSARSDLQDLINYFILPKEEGKKIADKQSYSYYEKQGAIPKRKFIDYYSNQCDNVKSVSKRKIKERSGVQDKQIKSKFSDDEKKNVPEVSKTNSIWDLNDSVASSGSLEKICLKPFFYIVPEKPSPNFSFPRGSYYVVPGAPNSSSLETVIIHPERSNVAPQEPGIGQEFSSPVCYNRNPGGVDLDSTNGSTHGQNNLGKNEPQRNDSHLNIGPTQVKEGYTTNNLESNCESNKIYEKNVELSPNRSGKASENKKDNTLLTETGDAERNGKSVLDNAEYSILEVLFQNEVQDEKLFSIQERLMSEFPDMAIASAMAIAEEFYSDEKGLQDYIFSRHLNQKILRQYDRLVKALPDKAPSELLEICNEFGGDEEREAAYIEEVKLKTKRQELVTNMQLILPDADPDFLLKEIERLSDDADAVNSLTLTLLEQQDYPKISDDVGEVKKRLWETYVENFQVEGFLREVLAPDFAGVSRNYKNEEVGLIMQFLSARYPHAPHYELLRVFESNNWNITQTCANLSDFEVVRLSESNFKPENFNEDFLKEICYIDHREEIEKYLREQMEMKEIEAEEARWNKAFLTCPLCFDHEVIPSEVVTCLEGDLFCKKCIKMYIDVKMADGIYKFECPVEGCGSFLAMSVLKNFLPGNVLSIINKKQQAEEIITAGVDGLEFCTHCDFAYIPNPNDKIFTCLNPTCMAVICRKCKENNHIPLRCEEVEREVDVRARMKIEEAMSESLIRHCPTCKKAFVKIDGCNKMRCSCGTLSCYICRQVITGYDHFNNGNTRCSLYSNNDELHLTAVVQAGNRARNEILEENPDVRIVHDPTKM